jgi:hypothetical protein
MQVRRKLHVLRMFGELKEFDYEPPNMAYDKKTGEVKILEKKGGGQEQKKRVIKNMDDLDKEKRALFNEVGLDSEGNPKNEKEPLDKMSDRIKQAADRMTAEFDIDPTGFNVFSRDQMRVDVGLLIQRPPIFVAMRDRDVHFLKYKNDIMNEYYCN